MGQIKDLWKPEDYTLLGVFLKEKNAKWQTQY